MPDDDRPLFEKPFDDLPLPSAAAKPSASTDPPLFEKPLDDLLPPDPPKRSTSAKDTRRPVYDLPERELVAIARLQQWMLVCIMLQVLLPLVIFVASIGVRREGAAVAVGITVWTLTVMALVSWVTRFVLMIVLSIRLFNPGMIALLLAFEILLSGSVVMMYLLFGRYLACFVEVFCFIGMMMSLVVNARATATLKRNGVRVGLLGARTADLPRVEKRETTMPKLGW